MYLFLEKFHGIEISLGTLKRRLAQYVLKQVLTYQMKHYVQKLCGNLKSIEISGANVVWLMVSRCPEIG